MTPPQDMLNLKDISENGDGSKWRIRFSYIEELTGKKKICQRHYTGPHRAAVVERDRLKQCLRMGISPDRDSTATPSAPRARGATFHDYKDAYLAYRKSRGANRRQRPLSIKTLKGDESCLRIHVLPKIGEWRVAHTPASALDAVIDEWYEELVEEQGYAAGSVNKYIQTMRSFVSYCCKQEGVVDMGVGLENIPQSVPVDRGPREPLEAHQVEPFFEALKERYPQNYFACFLALWGGGLRYGTVSALKWEDIDEEAGLIHFRRSQSLGVVKAGGKAGEMTSVPLEPFREALEFHKQEIDSNPRYPPIAETEWVFPSSILNHGKPRVHPMRWHAGSVNENLEKLCRDLGIERRTFHCFRHTFVTLGFAVGASETIIGSMTGHKTVQMMRHYNQTQTSTKAALISQIQALASQLREVSDDDDDDDLLRELGIASLDDLDALIDERDLDGN